MAQLARTDIGFQGGQVLSVRAAEDAIDALATGLAGDRGWHTLDTGEEQIRIDLSQVVYVRRETGDQKVGF